MTPPDDFPGFPRECVKFFQELKANNNKQWFERRKAYFQRYVMEPAEAFVGAMGERLRRIAPAVHAEPKVNKSIFRIHRDTRFTPDKSPYKTHLGIWFWEGEGPRMECSGFYFHLEPPRLMLGAGMHMFPKHVLEAYRQSVVHAKYGPGLTQAIVRTERRGWTVRGSHYKKTPQGYKADHPRAALLLYNGLYVGAEDEIPVELYSPAILDYCLSRYREMLPIHEWLVALTKRTRR
ncbi:MAG: DUF2461 domain-containing protein [Candidatus Coatesbacteria bacterium]|nr:MAG: DUF2461 domain-containing protein [Candidatus Coatesbacteria bacterium]